MVSIERFEGPLHVGDVPPGVRPWPRVKDGVSAGQVHQVVLAWGTHPLVPAVLVYWTVRRLFQNAFVYKVNISSWEWLWSSDYLVDRTRTWGSVPSPSRWSDSGRARPEARAGTRCCPRARPSASSRAPWQRVGCVNLSVSRQYRTILRLDQLKMLIWVPLNFLLIKFIFSPQTYRKIIKITA